MDQEACSPVSLPHAGFPKGQPYPCLWPTLSPSLRRRLGQEWDGEVLRNLDQLHGRRVLGRSILRTFFFYAWVTPEKSLPIPNH